MRIVTILVPDHVIGVAITVLIGACDAQENLVLHDRHIDRAFQLLVVVVTEFRLSIAFEIIGRLVRDEQNSATCGVTSEQSTLRPV